MYVGLAWHFWNTRWHTQTKGGLKAWERVAILVPLALHGWLLYQDLFMAAELRFGFAQALSVMLWLAVAICCLEALWYPIEALYALALLLAAACAPLTALFPGRLVSDAASFEFKLHLMAGILAYSLFTVATLHALLIAAVERRLHASHDLAHPMGLPPLLSLEQLVFRLIAAAFAVLTLTLIIGVAYSESMFGRALRFDHKTVFVVLSWLAFALLLAGRWLRGWRGRTAVRWTLAGFVMLLLAYPGSRFVLEVVLARP